MQVIYEKRLREKSAGIYEGKPVGILSKVAKSKGINPRNFEPENGESWIEVNKRVKDFIKDMISKHCIK